MMSKNTVWSPRTSQTQSSCSNAARQKMSVLYMSTVLYCTVCSLFYDSLYFSEIHFLIVTYKSQRLLKGVADTRAVFTVLQDVLRAKYRTEKNNHRNRI